MKKLHLVLILVVVFAVLTGGTAVAQEDGALEDGATACYEVGNLSPSIGVGFGYGFSPVFYPGVEFIVGEYNIENSFPLSFGAAARGYVNIYRDSTFGVDWGWTSYGVGAFGTVHLSFREVDADLSFLENFDFYTMLGLAFTVRSFTGDEVYYSEFSDTDFDFVSIGGVSYFFSDRLAIMAEGTYWGFGGATIGLRLLL